VLIIQAIVLIVSIFAHVFYSKSDMDCAHRGGSRLYILLFLCVSFTGTYYLLDILNTAYLKKIIIVSRLRLNIAYNEQLEGTGI
jgi:hypothetical protein